MLRIALLALLVCAAVTAPAAAKDLTATTWDVRLQSSLTYRYDMGEVREGAREVTRSGSGSVKLDVAQRSVLLPRQRGQVDRLFSAQLDGRQTPGPLTYLHAAPDSGLEQRCDGHLTAGGGEYARPGRRFRSEKPTTTSRDLEVTAAGIAIPFGRVSAYAQCTSDGSRMPMLTSTRKPHVLVLPADFASRRKVTLRAAGWHAYAPCSEQDPVEGSGEPPATIEAPEGACAPVKVLTERVTLTLTRRCRTAVVKRSGGLSITDCRKR